MTCTGYKKKHQRIGAIFVDECEILVKMEEKCQEVCYAKDIAYVRPGIKASSSMPQVQPKIRERDQQSEDENPRPRVSRQNQRMPHLQPAFPIRQTRFCLQHQWNWFSQKWFQKMIRTLLNWKTHLWGLKRCR